MSILLIHISALRLIHRKTQHWTRGRLSTAALAIHAVMALAVVEVAIVAMVRSTDTTGLLSIRS